MPFPLIPTALGVCFFLVWAFIGGMIVRDGQLAAQRDRDIDANILPLAPHRPTWASLSESRNRVSERRDHVAAAS